MPILLSLTSPSLQMYQKVDQDKKKAEIDAMKKKYGVDGKEIKT